MTAWADKKKDYYLHQPGQHKPIVGQNKGLKLMAKSFTIAGVPNVYLQVVKLCHFLRPEIADSES